MRPQQIAVRAALVGAAATAGLALWAATEDTAAHAADHRPAVEQPGGLLDHTVRLPEQAAARAKAAVAKVTAETTPEPAPVEPTPTDAPAPVEDRAPAPEPTTDPPPLEVPVVETPPAVEPAPVVDTPPVEVPPADVPPAEVPPASTDVPPLPTPSAPSTEDEPPVVTLPSIDPAPLPDAEDPIPAPVGVPEVGALPVIIGPVPAIAPPAAPVDQLVTALTSAELADPDYCADEPDDAGDVGRDAIGDLIASLTDPAAAPRAKPAPGCPGTPDHPAADGAGTASVAASGHTAGPQCLADVTAGLVAPTLARLEHARARSTIPTGRTTRLDPRPA